MDLHPTKEHTSLEDIVLKNANDVANFRKSCALGKADGSPSRINLQIHKRNLCKDTSDKETGSTKIFGDIVLLVILR